MGIAERFKNRLEKQNIFEKPKTQIAKNISEKSYVSNPQTFNNSHYIYENLEEKLITKIRNTPHWNEYSTIKKEQMITSYFKAKTLKNPASTDCCEFTKNILDLINI